MANQKLTTANLASVIQQKAFPGITVWNRLEGRPRADRFDRALRAEVRDPLWMLTRQWQMGEFRGDDAGSPFFAKAHLETTRILKFQAADSVEPVDESRPLEPIVEKMPLHFEQAGRPVALDLRLLMGRHWLRMVTPLAAAAGPEFIANYAIDPPNITDAAQAATVAHPEALSAFAAAAGRLMDGYKLYQHLVANPANNAADGILALAGLEPQAKDLGDAFVAWFQRLIAQPDEDSAWLPDRLEYRFAMSAPHATGEKVLVADGYHHGHLDWHSFDVDPDQASLGAAEPQPPVPTTLTMMPVPAGFNGMPNTRWWKFEDGRTNFGDIKPDTTDLAKLLLMEFGLVYANDWFLIPFTVPVGSIARLRGLAVTNVFGERTWIEAAGRGLDDNWQRWAMFLVSTRGEQGEQADLSLVVPPVAVQVGEGVPEEEILFARDEMANMVWGIERRIPLPSGESKPGREAADETRSYFERDLEARLGAPPEPLPPAPGVKIRYKVMTNVPENWIPMIPVHVGSDNREVQLQRAAMPRVLVGDTDPKPAAVRPRTSLLRVGLDQGEKYLIHEEEVTRAGIRVTQSFQRTRTRTGEVLVWLGVRKQTGRGEGSSGLAFDGLEDVS